MLSDKVPERLYKYRFCDTHNYFLKLLKENSFFFSSPKHFNDPFDCRVYPDYGGGSKSEIMERYLKHVKFSHPELGLGEQKKIAKLNYKNNISIIRSPELAAIRLNDQIDNGYGIFSLCEQPDNLLMWAHYSDCHKGFCIEFDAQKLAKICENYIMVGDLILVKRVNYLRNYPLINPYKHEIDDPTFIECITTKSLDWSYEKEWRLIYTKHPDESLEFPPNIITSIYFGVNSPTKTIGVVKEQFSDRNCTPKFYKARLNHREFGITFEKM